MKQIILFSGGLDSVCAAHLHPEAFLLYINYHGRYCAKEVSHLDETVLFLNRNINVINNRLNLEGLEVGEGAFLPNRNALLILTAATCFSNVRFPEENEIRFILNATAAGIHPDKDQTFAEMLTHLMNYMNRGGKDSKAVIYHIDLPTRYLTKPEIVHLYLEKNGSHRALRSATSCYDANQRQCGHCRSCLRKYVALVWNGLDAGDFSTSPAHQFKMVRERCHAHTWCSNPKEEAQTLEVVGA